MVDEFNYEKEVAEARKNAERLYDAAGDELARLLEERDRLNAQIVAVRRDLEQFAMIAGVKAEDPEDSFGLTNAVRWALGTAEGVITAQAIKERLTGATYIELPADPMPSILTILRRLIISKEVEPFKKPSGTYYQWVGGLPPAPPAPKRTGVRFADGQPTAKIILDHVAGVAKAAAEARRVVETERQMAEEQLKEAKEAMREKLKK